MESNGEPDAFRLEEIHCWCSRFVQTIVIILAFIHFTVGQCWCVIDQQSVGAISDARYFSNVVRIQNCAIFAKRWPMAQIDKAGVAVCDIDYGSR